MYIYIYICTGLPVSQARPCQTGRPGGPDKPARSAGRGQRGRGQGALRSQFVSFVDVVFSLWVDYLLLLLEP